MAGKIPKAVMPTTIDTGAYIAALSSPSNWLLPMEIHFLNNTRLPYQSFNSAATCMPFCTAGLVSSALSGLPNPANLASPSFGPWLVILVRIRPPKRPATTTPLINLKHSSAHLEVPRIMLLATIVVQRPLSDGKAPGLPLRGAVKSLGARLHASR